MENTLPKIMELEPGTYYWCSCGRSKNGPLCDGSHKGTSFLPVEFTVKEKRKTALCTCGRTKNAPACDGTHARQ